MLQQVKYTKIIEELKETIANISLSLNKDKLDDEKLNALKESICRLQNRSQDSNLYKDLTEHETIDLQRRLEKEVITALTKAYKGVVALLYEGDIPPQAYYLKNIRDIIIVIINNIYEGNHRKIMYSNLQHYINDAFDIRNILSEQELYLDKLKTALNLGATTTCRINSFIAAINERNSKALEILLQFEPDCVNENHRETSPLIHAAGLKSLKSTDSCFNILLQHKELEINKPSTNGKTALMAASNARKAKLLLDRGAKIEQRDKKGNTALLTAVLELKPEVFYLLLQNGANINAIDNKGNGINEKLGEALASIEEYSREYKPNVTKIGQRRTNHAKIIMILKKLKEDKIIQQVIPRDLESIPMLRKSIFSAIGTRITINFDSDSEYFLGTSSEIKSSINKL